MSDLNDEQRQQIMSALKLNRKIEAIKIYRDATGSGLKEAKEFIEALAERLHEENPETFSKPQTAGCSVSMLLVLTALSALGLLSLGLFS